MILGSSPLARGKPPASAPGGTPLVAHPRSRGENHLICATLRPPHGSSPLARGKLLSRSVDERRERLIPARAGKTGRGRGLRRTQRAHPRSRGENVGCLAHPLCCGGSSPLARGKQIAPSSLQVRERLIPARAGKTHGSSVTSVRRPGSSPLARGKQPRGSSRRGRRGLIPARAGKTVTHRYPLPTARAHPRSRGENNSARSDARGIAGSSPLTRGKLQLAEDAANMGGLIPAHAGKTHWPLTVPQTAWAHPRSRGENPELDRQGQRRRGSSPLTRGKPYKLTARIDKERLIPAHAGKTYAARPGERGRQAHPRSRGENSTASASLWQLLGSSPLTRGKRTKQGAQLLIFGLIPAHAGKTVKMLTMRSATGAHPRSRGENIRGPRPRNPDRGSSPLTRGKRRLGCGRDLW